MVKSYFFISYYWFNFRNVNKISLYPIHDELLVLLPDLFQIKFKKNNVR